MTLDLDAVRREIAGGNRYWWPDLRDYALELIEEVERLRAALDEAQLRSIEARNPGIDIDEVRRMRTAAYPERCSSCDWPVFPSCACPSALTKGGDPCPPS